MPDSSTTSTILMLVLMVAAFYFLLIRPAQKKQREQQKMVSSLAEGSRVMTTAGVYGTIIHLGTRQAIVEIAPGVEMTILKQAIMKAVDPSEDEFEYDDAVPETEAGFEDFGADEPAPTDRPDETR